MQTLITGIRPSATLTIANLIGSVVPLLELQDLPDTDVRVFVATMHGLTDHEPADIVPNVPEIVRDYLALGLDPAKVTIFDQRTVREEVALLKLYLERHITVARACRVPALKDKLREGERPEEANVLLMGYPIMMAADILLQDAAVVPVGKDQYAHLEVTRELTDTFNKKYGSEKHPVLTRPDTLNRDAPVNILALTGEGKMSKSKPETAVFLTDDEAVIRKKIKRAETAFEGEKSDKLDSLIHIAHALAPERAKEVDEVVARHMAGEKVMGTLKPLIADIVADFATDFQHKRSHIDDKTVAEILEHGSTIAKKSACTVLARVEQALGVVS